MKKNRVLYLLGLVVGLAGAVMLIPQARTIAQALIVQVVGRARTAWDEGKKAKRRREHELEEVVLGSEDSKIEEDDAPDYIV